MAFHTDRGSAEQRTKEGKRALNETRLSCRRFAAPTVQPQLHALACNLTSLQRTPSTPEKTVTLSLT
ncbi:MAG: transposase [Rhodospirillaceae bacterium]|nr:transposase [Rhodospirillaceae bacterium]